MPSNSFSTKSSSVPVSLRNRRSPSRKRGLDLQLRRAGRAVRAGNHGEQHAHRRRRRRRQVDAVQDEVADLGAVGVGEHLARRQFDLERAGRVVATLEVVAALEAQHDRRGLDVVVVRDGHGAGITRPLEMDVLLGEVARGRLDLAGIVLVGTMLDRGRDRSREREQEPEGRKDAQQRPRHLCRYSTHDSCLQFRTDHMCSVHPPKKMPDESGPLGFAGDPGGVYVPRLVLRYRPNDLAVRSGGVSGSTGATRWCGEAPQVPVLSGTRSGGHRSNRRIHGTKAPLPACVQSTTPLGRRGVMLRTYGAGSCAVRPSARQRQCKSHAHSLVPKRLLAVQERAETCSIDYTRVLVPVPRSTRSVTCN